MLISRDELNEFSKNADEYIITRNHKSLSELVEKLTEQDLEFKHPLYKAHYFYMIANCYSALYEPRNVEWYSDDLMKAVIFYRKALHSIPKIDWCEDVCNIHAYENLRTQILTNLANSLSSQGRILCCIPLYDQAISINNKIEAIASKARNQLVLAESLYDNGHKEYHYLIAYQHIKDAIKNIDQLFPEQRTDLEGDGYLLKFKDWFEQSFEVAAFDYFKDECENFESNEQKEYLQWCAKNKLFINDLNEVCEYEISYQDVLALPSFVQSINTTLTIHEELSYHGNFDELKNDYCYARYLFFSAQNISDDAPHFFNSTYQHVDDMSYSFNNLKIGHYKSAFRILYSLFDKVAYFISRFFNLNEIKDDKMVSIDSLFRNFKCKQWRKNWKPHEKLKDSDNHFLHALFYILKDIRDVANSSSVSKWIDPDAKAFSDIRNAIEHRSLKIVDDFGYKLTQSGQSYHKSELNKIEHEIKNVKDELIEINKAEAQAKKDCNDSLIKQLEAQKWKLNLKFSELQSKVYEKEKLSSHSLLIPKGQFESRLMTLMQLARNSIMYLSLAIYFEERKRPSEGIYLSKEVPLKN
ncbi:MAG: LA2681 family HEPN domain-containing protein [Halodesulfovibrio sp.]|uniref:LA2681 family HEPN domain-containing protein n=1 Tax=Halodesulfovibrio sp. TaxID=1912772 RepID=UPI00359DEFB5